MVVGVTEICQRCGVLAPAHNLSQSGWCSDCLGVSPNGSQPDLPVLDADARYGLPGEVVELLENYTESDPVARLMDFLVSFGSAVGPGPHAVADGTAHPARLFALLVGKTSKARKGTSRRRIGNLFMAVDPAWATDRVMGGLSSGEGLIAAAAEGGTLEDPRLMLVEEEVSRTLAVAAREGSTLSPIIRQAWDHGNLRVMTRHQPLKVSGTHISILAHSTVEDVRRRLTETDVMNGFANRFLFAFVKRHAVIPEAEEIDQVVLNSFVRTIRSRVDAARRVERLRRSKEAAALWEKIYRKIASDESDGLFGAATARADAQTLRLSVAYALTDGSSTIEVDHLKAAWALWRYCEASARHLFGGKRGDTVEDRLLEGILATGSRGLDVTGQHALFGRNLSGETLGVARSSLEEKGLIQTVPEGEGVGTRLVSYGYETNESTNRGEER